MMEFVLFTDGATRPTNPGPSGYGAVLYADDCQVDSVNGYLGDGVSNNQAEYAGLLAGLEMVDHALNGGTFGASSLTIRPDSMLLINQVEGSWAVRSAKLGPFHAAIKAKLETIRLTVLVGFEHVKGHSGNLGNELADKLASRAIDDEIPCSPTVARYLSQSQAKKGVAEKGHEKLAAQVRETLGDMVLDTGINLSGPQRARLYRQGNPTDKLLLHFPPLARIGSPAALITLSTGFKRQDNGPALRTMDRDAFDVAKTLAAGGATVILVHRPHAGGRWRNFRELNWGETTFDVPAMCCPVASLTPTESFDQEGWPTFVGIEAPSSLWTPL